MTTLSKTDKEKALLAKFLLTLQENPTSITRIVKSSTTGAQLDFSKLTQEIRKFDKNVHYWCLSPTENLYSDKPHHFVTYSLDGENNVAFSHPIKQLQQKIFKEQIGDCYCVIENTLGAGTFGKVKSTHVLYWFDASKNLHRTECIQKFAIKSEIIKPCIIRREEKRLEAFQEEAAVGVEYFDFFYSQPRARVDKKNKIDLYMPQIEGKSVMKLMEDPNLSQINLSDLIKILLNFAKEIKRLHDKGYVHNDIKSENVIANLGTGSATLIDVGTACQYDNELVIGLHSSIYYGPNYNVYASNGTYHKSFKEYFAFATTAMVLFASYIAAIEKKEDVLQQTKIEAEKLDKTYYQYFEEFIKSYRPSSTQKYNLINILDIIFHLPEGEKVDVETVLIQPLTELYNEEIRRSELRNQLIEALKTLKKCQEQYDQFVGVENLKGNFKHTFVGRINARIKIQKLLSEAVALTNNLYYASLCQSTPEEFEQDARQKIDACIQKFIDTETCSNKHSTNSFASILTKYKNGFFGGINSVANFHFSPEDEPPDEYCLAGIRNILADIIMHIASFFMTDFSCLSTLQLQENESDGSFKKESQDSIICNAN